MSMMRIKELAVLGALVMSAAGLVFAQEPVPGLQDLVGAKGAGGEQTLQGRGYTWVRTEKSDDAAYGYWRGNENGRCIVVRTSEGRYASIVYAPDSDCKAGQTAPAAGHVGPNAFDTVCGVIVDGKTYRYKCKVEDVYAGANKTRSILHFPDQTIEMVWKPGNQVELHFEGMVPATAKYATAEGETNFVFEDKTYFYISDKGMARSEVENFRE
jgi:hypothetical protein